MIWRSKTSFATTSGRADFVCQTETERSSAPSAATEQMFEATTEELGSRRNICGLYAYSGTLNSKETEGQKREGHTATSIVFSWPTRLISDVQLFRAITAAIKTKPLLFVAFDAVICAPSGDQLDVKKENPSARSHYSPLNRYVYDLKRRKNVLPGESSNGFVTSASSCQSVVRHILTERSSDCVARNSPTGSQHTPLTKPWCWSSLHTRSMVCPASVS